MVWLRYSFKVFLPKVCSVPNILILMVMLYKTSRMETNNVQDLKMICIILKVVLNYEKIYTY